MSVKSTKTVNADFVTATKCVHTQKCVVDGDFKVKDLVVDPVKLDLLMKFADALVEATTVSAGQLQSFDSVEDKINTSSQDAGITVLKDTLVKLKKASDAASLYVAPP
tara:strand:+ start:275 stop:598 length:324 start_codon:yes stop_codon:yes gene_type:complete